MFTAGGNAAAKSTALLFTKERSRAQVVFDSTFSNLEHAARLIDQALMAQEVLEGFRNLAQQRSAGKAQQD